MRLSVAVAYLRALEAGGVALDDARRMIFFRCRADADQFMTMAKFRALAEALGARRGSVRARAAAGLHRRGNRVADDDAARSLREHAAGDDRGVRRRPRRRQCGDGAAVHVRARPAGCIRAARRAQHAAHPAGRIQSREGGRSGRGLRRHRGPDRSALPRRLGVVPGDREGGRRGGARNRLDSDQGRRDTRRRAKRRSPPARIR